MSFRESMNITVSAMENNVRRVKSLNKYNDRHFIYHRCITLSGWLVDIGVLSVKITILQSFVAICSMATTPVVLQILYYRNLRVRMFNSQKFHYRRFQDLIQYVQACIIIDMDVTQTSIYMIINFKENISNSNIKL